MQVIARFLTDWFAEPALFVDEFELGVPLGWLLPCQVGDVEPQRARDAVQHRDAGVAFPQFHPAQICLMNVREVREFFLRDATIATRLLKIEPDPDTHVHMRMGEAGSDPSHRL